MDKSIVSRFLTHDVHVVSAHQDLNYSTMAAENSGRDQKHQIEADLDIISFIFLYFLC